MFLARIFIQCAGYLYLVPYHQTLLFLKMRVFVNIRLLFTLLFFTNVVNAQNHYWQQRVDVTINVKLNDIEHSLDAFETISYTNNSPDTLKFIWFHIWPNAYKNDKTAFSEQMLNNRRTTFYFSNKDQRGYINRLDFKVDDLTAETEDHPQYIDVVKVLLPIPLAPGKTTIITTPFHVQLPYNFSRGGHVKSTYQITQWFPKPAVYDKTGWHEMPYLDQGEFYSEFGDYDVSITLPKDYVVAATGDLQNDDEIEWMKSKKDYIKPKLNNPSFKPGYKSSSVKFKKPTPNNLPRETITQQPATKTLRYIQRGVHDFAWFADKHFIVNTDTLRLPSGRIINAWSFYLPVQAEYWKQSVASLKNTILKYSKWLGEYPHNNVTAVQANIGGGGMEYPTITLISRVFSQENLDDIISHEVGHNWLQGILATNERDYAWMDEGFNSYYDQRKSEFKETQDKKRLPGNLQDLALRTAEAAKEDQPINTPSEQFTNSNYGLIAYYKAGEWMKMLEQKLGRNLFDSSMHEYYRQWQFKHPQPGDFKKVLEDVSGRNMDDFFSKLNETGPLNNTVVKKKIAPAFLYDLRDTDKKQYISFAPAIGYNEYDRFMVGAIIHDYQLPLPRLQFVLTPMYATNSKTFAGIGRIGYNWLKPTAGLKKIEFAVSGAKFSTRDGVDTNGAKIFSGFYKIVPALKIDLSNKSPLSTIHKWIEWKTYFIGENSFNYVQNSVDSNYYPSKATYTTRYINQLTFGVKNNRIIYPYDAQLQVQQSSSFWKATFTGNYFLNYAKGGGANVRLFVAKFGYIGSSSSVKQYENSRYMPKLTAVRGYDDYTYSNYFIGRNETEGFASQQIMSRDGDLKILRTDFYTLPSRSDDWVAAINLNTTLPYTVIPKWLPLKLFVDVGTTAEAWNKNETTINTSRILYVGGIQLSLFRNILNIYAPLVYSKDFKNELKTDPDTDKFGKRISFSIDIQKITAKKIIGNKLPM